MPYPVKGKKWVGIEGDYTAYDTSLDNNAGCPYFEGVINNRDISIHLIYEDSIPHTGEIQEVEELLILRINLPKI